jgi:hypothetical protein
VRISNATGCNGVAWQEFDSPLSPISSTEAQVRIHLARTFSWIPLTPVLAAFSTVTRYEGLSLFLVLILLIAIVGVVKRKKRATHRWRDAAVRRTGRLRDRPVGVVVLTAHRQSTLLPE